MRLRAQLSLLFDDEELFNNFVLPYKDQRLLNSVIIKCLSAYYYNPDIRSIVEGDTFQSNDEEDTSKKEMFDNIRTTLLMQEFMTTELGDTLQAGSENINDILNKANNMAKEAKFAEEQESEYGSGIFKLDFKKLENKQEEETSQDCTKVTTDSTAIKILFSVVKSLAKSSGNTEALRLLDEYEVDGNEEELKTSIDDTDLEVVNSNTGLTQNNLGNSREAGNFTESTSDITETIDIISNLQNTSSTRGSTSAEFSSGSVGTIADLALSDEIASFNSEVSTLESSARSDSKETRGTGVDVSNDSNSVNFNDSSDTNDYSDITGDSNNLLEDGSESIDSLMSSLFTMY